MATLRNLTVREETVDDVVAAVDLLRQTEGVDPKRIFVLGHSLGAMLLPRIATFSPGIAGLIALAGPTRPLEDLFLEQTNYLVNLEGTLTPSSQAQLKELQIQQAKIKDPTLALDYPELLLGAPASYWLDLRGYNAAEASLGLHLPMLILQGERDYQVTMEDFQGWKRALAGRRDVEYAGYPALNHLFIEGQGPSRPDEYQQAGHIAPAVIEDIARWIGRH